MQEREQLWERPRLRVGPNTLEKLVLDKRTQSTIVTGGKARAHGQEAWR